MPDRPRPSAKGRTPPRLALGFADLHASPGDHIGHFYQSRHEWLDVLVPYLNAGLEAGGKCVYVIPEGPERQVLLEALSETGVDVRGAQAAGRLLLDEGHRDPPALQAFLHRVLSDVPEKFPFVRWGGDMTWSVKRLPTSESLMTWETYCNRVANPPAVFLCQYELAAFSGHVVIDALSTHPLCLVGRAIHQNPFYEQPDAFLHRLARRHLTPATT